MTKVPGSKEPGALHGAALRMFPENAWAIPINLNGTIQQTRSRYARC